MQEKNFLYKIESDLDEVFSLFSEFYIDFNVKKFLENIDRKLNKKNKFTSEINLWEEIISTWETQYTKSIFKKKIKKLNSHLNREIISYLFDEGALLPSIDKNFKLVKIIKPKINVFDGDFEKALVYQIISSKENNTFYILVSEDILMSDSYTIRCIKKTYNKLDAIKFVKDKINKLKNQDKINRNFRNKQKNIILNNIEKSMLKNPDK